MIALPIVTLPTDCWAMSIIARPYSDARKRYAIWIGSPVGSDADGGPIVSGGWAAVIARG